MRLRIVSAFFCLSVSFQVNAQVTSVNPLEYTALAEGNDAINKEIEKQVNGKTQTAMLQNTIAAEFDQIQRWQMKYNSYLKTASGYASTLKASTQLYNEGVRCFIYLGKLKQAIGNNPQGIVATMSMNNLYVETATELVTIYTMLKNAVATGGPNNMLTGAERSHTLWALNDRLGEFNKKLSRLHLSVRYYTMTDVWNNVTAGMIDRDNSQIASQAFSRWRRTANLVRP